MALDLCGVAVSDLGYQAAVRDAGSRGLAEDWGRLGAMLMERGLWGSAAGCFARAVELEPGDYRGWTNLGWCLDKTGRSELAAKLLREAMGRGSEEAKPHALLSQVLLALGDVGEAISRAGRAVELDPSDPVNHLALGLALMRGGHWGDGWREYEHRARVRIPEFMSRPYRWWRGEWCRTLYIECEQGAGDSLFAARWFPRCFDLVDQTVLYCHQSLYSLFEDQFGGSRVSVYPMPRPIPEADAWVPAMSIPAALGVSEAFWPGEYIDPGILVGWDGHDRKRPRRVAIAWSGDPIHENAAHRDCPLECFLPLSEIPGVRLHSIQIGHGHSQFVELGCYGLIEDRAPEISNFSDTAKVLAGMDLVICVDTAVGHLAGAMGVPCWLLVNRRGQDFRWGMDGETTPWYPGHRLFRRGLDEEWMAVMGRVVGELREFAGGSGYGDHGAAAGRGRDAAGYGGSGLPVPTLG